MRRIVAAEVQHGVARRGELDPRTAPLTGTVGARFEIVGLLGAGGQGRTWLAKDLVRGDHVAVKELSLRTVADWKAVELFDREARVLEALSHPAIPRYVDAFHDAGPPGSTDGTRFFLAQEYVEGLNLQQDLETHQWSEPEAIELLRRVLDVLDYLHTRSPPVIHRDLKPSNLIRRKDGRLALIDFGAVQTVSPTLTGGSTIIGSNGYMPLEQYMGRAVPATDLYALGATAVHLLSRRHPADLPLVRARLDFTGAIHVSPGLVGVLTRLLEPTVEDRFATAKDVLRALDALGSGPSGEVVATDDEGDAIVWRADNEADDPAEAVEPDELSADVGEAWVPELAERPRSYAIKRAFRRLVFLFLAYAFVQSGLWVSPRCGGGYSEAVEQLEQCPPARDALGTDIGQAWPGWACGNCEASGSCSSESWSGGGTGTMVVSGSRDTGRLSWSSGMSGCNWSVTNATLSVDDREIQVVPCPGAAVSK